MSLQYARFYQLYGAIKVLSEAEEGLTRDELIDELVSRKDLSAPPGSKEGAKDVITELKNAHLLTISDGSCLLSSEDDLPEQDIIRNLLYTGRQVAESIRVQDDAEAYGRLLTNLCYAHPEVIPIARHVYRHGPIKKHEVKRKFDGEAPFGNKLNDFTIDMGMNLLTDADVLEQRDSEYVADTCPLPVFGHLLYEVYDDLSNGGSATESDLFSRLELMYGIDRDTFDNHLSRLAHIGLITRGSYGEIELNQQQFNEAHIHE